MALTRYNMKRWLLMLQGKSLFHVNQEIGKCFTKTGLTGYYNDRALEANQWLCNFLQLLMEAPSP